MKLVNLELKNYKGFQKSTIEMDGKSTIFFGPNGVGKSSILEAVSAIYIPILSGIISKGTDVKLKKPKDHLDIDDIKYGESMASIHGKIQLEDQMFSYSRNISRKKKEDYREGKLSFIETYCKHYLREEEVGYQESKDNSLITMPIFAKYGTHRAIRVVKVQRVRNQHQSFDKVFALENCIESSFDFRTFFEWFRTEQEIENSEKVRRNDIAYEDLALSCVKKVILAMLGERFSDIKIMFNPLRMVATKNGENLKIEQLSNGEKCTLAMVGDLARRLAIANPNQG